jgi:hypothetical protein
VLLVLIFIQRKRGILNRLNAYECKKFMSGH